MILSWLLQNIPSLGISLILYVCTLQVVIVSCYIVQSLIFQWFFILFINNFLHHFKLFSICICPIFVHLPFGQISISPSRKTQNQISPLLFLYCHKIILVSKINSISINRLLLILHHGILFISLVIIFLLKSSHVCIKSSMLLSWHAAFYVSKLRYCPKTYTMVYFFIS